ncbi:hypothetical protein HPB48_009848 [Haemaphysalis longicornis]|uniref:Major facilitator superfamily (MFS) profile domain-containing protein n=1 Tax=Haemaphysalis longicornis TaxID=44386 RepID=A0A9J6GUW4_HAELO|nr:hypothetical protein HPB48_009848 [Haemaphysalis longicornis]
MWNLVCDRQWLYQFSFFLYMVGPVFSAPVAGALADRFGRRPVIVTLLWVFSFASMVSAAANSFFMFLIARLLISATSYAAFALLFILLYEVTDNEHRAILAFVSSAVGLTLTPPAVHVVSWLQPSWYLAQIFLVAPTVLLAVLSSLIQESPIWLLASGMTQQAEQNILRTARMNGTNLARAKVTFRALKAQIKAGEEAASTPASSSKTCARSWLFSSGSPLSAALAWFTLTLALYVLFMPTSTKPWFEEATYVVLETLFYSAICWYMRRNGYRHALWLSLILLCVFWALFVVLNFVGYPRVVSHLTRLAQLATHSGVTVNYCYTAEAFPAAARAKGFFFSAFIGRLGGLLATLMRLNPGRTTTMLAHMAFALLALLTAVGVQWLPELVFFKKEKTKRAASPEVMSEKQKKEMIKASLSPRKKSTKTRIRSPRPCSDKPRARSLKPESPLLKEAKSPKSAENLLPHYGSTKPNSPKFVQSR